MSLRRSPGWYSPRDERGRNSPASALDRARHQARRMANMLMMTDDDFAQLSSESERIVRLHSPIAGQEQGGSSSRGHQTAPRRSREHGGLDGLDIVSELDLNFLNDVDSNESRGMDLTSDLKIFSSETLQNKRRVRDRRDLTSGLDLHLPSRRSRSPIHKMRQYLNELGMSTQSERRSAMTSPPRVEPPRVMVTLSRSTVSERTPEVSARSQRWTPPTHPLRPAYDPPQHIPLLVSEYATPPSVCSTLQPPQLAPQLHPPQPPMPQPYPPQPHPLPSHSLPPHAPQPHSPLYERRLYPPAKPLPLMAPMEHTWGRFDGRRSPESPPRHTLARIERLRSRSSSPRDREARERRYSSSTPRRESLDRRRSLSPPGRKSLERRRTPSPPRRRSLERRRTPSPARWRRSHSPLGRRSPERRRSSSPPRRRSQERRRSRSPPQRRSLERRRTPSPGRWRRSPSPLRRKSYERRRSSSPPRRRSLERHRSRSPNQRRSLERRSTPSPGRRRRSPSPLRRRSRERRRSSSLPRRRSLERRHAPSPARWRHSPSPPRRRSHERRRSSSLTRRTYRERRRSRSPPLRRSRERHRSPSPPRRRSRERHRSRSPPRRGPLKRQPITQRRRTPSPARRERFRRRPSPPDKLFSQLRAESAGKYVRGDLYLDGFYSERRSRERRLSPSRRGSRHSWERRSPERRERSGTYERGGERGVSPHTLLRRALHPELQPLPDSDPRSPHSLLMKALKRSEASRSGCVSPHADLRKAVDEQLGKLKAASDKKRTRHARERRPSERESLRGTPERKPSLRESARRTPEPRPAEQGTHQRQKRTRSPRGEKVPLKDGEEKVSSVLVEVEADSSGVPVLDGSSAEASSERAGVPKPDLDDDNGSECQASSTTCDDKQDDHDEPKMTPAAPAPGCSRPPGYQGKINVEIGSESHDKKHDDKDLSKEMDSANSVPDSNQMTLHDDGEKAREAVESPLPVSDQQLGMHVHNMIRHEAEPSKDESSPPNLCNVPDTVGVPHSAMLVDNDGQTDDSIERELEQTTVHQVEQCEDFPKDATAGSSDSSTEASSGRACLRQPDGMADRPERIRHDSQTKSLDDIQLDKEEPGGTDTAPSTESILQISQQSTEISFKIEPASFSGPSAEASSEHASVPGADQELNQRGDTEDNSEIDKVLRDEKQGAEDQSKDTKVAVSVPESSQRLDSHGIKSARHESDKKSVGDIQDDREKSKEITETSVPESGPLLDLQGRKRIGNEADRTPSENRRVLDRHGNPIIDNASRTPRSLVVVNSEGHTDDLTNKTLGQTAVRLVDQSADSSKDDSDGRSKSPADASSEQASVPEASQELDQHGSEGIKHKIDRVQIDDKRETQNQPDDTAELSQRLDQHATKKSSHESDKKIIEDISSGREKFKEAMETSVSQCGQLLNRHGDRRNKADRKVCEIKNSALDRHGNPKVVNSSRKMVVVDCDGDTDVLAKMGWKAVRLSDRFANSSKNESDSFAGSSSQTSSEHTPVPRADQELGRHGSKRIKLESDDIRRDDKQGAQGRPKDTEMAAHVPESSQLLDNREIKRVRHVSGSKSIKDVQGDKKKPTETVEASVPSSDKVVNELGRKRDRSEADRTPREDKNSLVDRHGNLRIYGRPCVMMVVDSDGQTDDLVGTKLGRRTLRLAEQVQRPSKAGSAGSIGSSAEASSPHASAAEANQELDQHGNKKALQVSERTSYTDKDSALDRHGKLKPVSGSHDMLVIDCDGHTDDLTDKKLGQTTIRRGEQNNDDQSPRDVFGKRKRLTHRVRWKRKLRLLRDSKDPAAGKVTMKTSSAEGDKFGGKHSNSEIGRGSKKTADSSEVDTCIDGKNETPCAGHADRDESSAPMESKVEGTETEIPDEKKNEFKVDASTDDETIGQKDLDNQSVETLKADALNIDDSAVARHIPKASCPVSEAAQPNAERNAFLVCPPDAEAKTESKQNECQKTWQGQHTEANSDTGQGPEVEHAPEAEPKTETAPESEMTSKTRVESMTEVICFGEQRSSPNHSSGSEHGEVSEQRQKQMSQSEPETAMETASAWPPDFVQKPEAPVTETGQEGSEAETAPAETQEGQLGQRMEELPEREQKQQPARKMTASASRRIRRRKEEHRLKAMKNALLRLGVRGGRLGEAAGRVGDARQRHRPPKRYREPAEPSPPAEVFYTLENGAISELTEDRRGEVLRGDSVVEKVDFYAIRGGRIVRVDREEVRRALRTQEGGSEEAETESGVTETIIASSAVDTGNGGSDAGRTKDAEAAKDSAEVAKSDASVADGEVNPNDEPPEEAVPVREACDSV